LIQAFLKTSDDKLTVDPSLFKNLLRTGL